MTVQEITALFVAARAHGVVRFKVGDLEVLMDASKPPLRRDTNRKAKPRDAMDLAIELSQRPGQDE